jgi:hypothetical protein
MEAGGIAQVVECLLAWLASIRPISNPSTTKKKKKACPSKTAQINNNNKKYGANASGSHL